MGKQWKLWQTLFWWGSKITADGDCSHEIKRHLLLERKAMTKLVSILKRRDIPLPTKVRLVKAMVFPVVVCVCESWTIKKDEHWRIDAFELWCWRRLLRVPWTERRSNQSILMEISPEYSLEGLMLKLQLQNFGHLMRRSDSFENILMLGNIEGRKRRGQQILSWLDGKELDMTEWLNWTEHPTVSLQKKDGYSVWTGMCKVMYPQDTKSTPVYVVYRYRISFQNQNYMFYDDDELRRNVKMGLSWIYFKKIQPTGLTLEEPGHE